MMRIPALAAAAGLMLSLPAAPLSAKDQWVYDGKAYPSLAECQRAKKNAKKKGAIVGAVGGAATVAIFGGNVGQAALGAGAGAAAGAVIGKSSKKC